MVWRVGQGHGRALTADAVFHCADDADDAVRACVPCEQCPSSPDPAASFTSLVGEDVEDPPLGRVRHHERLPCALQRPRLAVESAPTR